MKPLFARFLETNDTKTSSWPKAVFHTTSVQISAHPDFTLKDRFGKDWTLSEHRGRVVVLNFWTVTCKPCLQEMPTIETLGQVAKRWGDVDIVTVSTDAGWDVARPFVNPNSRLTYLFDPKQTVVRDAFGTKLYPETWIIDKKGVVRLRYDGVLDWADPVALDMIAAYR